jgi:hypothetical protein
MKKYLITTLAAGALFGIGFVAGSTAASAHHSVQMYDMQKEVTVAGTVKDFQYTNPHSWLLVDVKNDDGTSTTWGFEAEGPGILMRAGIKRNSLPAGTKVTVTGHPMKDGRPAATWIKLKMEDGTEMVPHAQR